MQSKENGNKGDGRGGGVDLQSTAGQKNKAVSDAIQTLVAKDHEACGSCDAERKGRNKIRSGWRKGQSVAAWLGMLVEGQASAGPPNAGH